jgi:glycosyltransferase involved in cell wall biosynthesis
MYYKLKHKKWEVPKFTFKEFSKKKTKYCVIIPVLNEGEKIQKELLKMKKLGTGKKADIIIADWGSTDGSLKHKFLKSCGVRTLLVKKSFGKLGAQMRMALAYAMEQGYQGFSFIDGNNKDNPEAIPCFLKKLDEGYDYIQGSRYMKGGKAVNTPFVRHFATKIVHATLMSFFAGRRFTDTTNGYRSFSRKLIGDQRVYPFREIFVAYELLFYITIRASRLGFKITNVPVTRAYPKTGKVPTKISPIKGYAIILYTTIKAGLGYYNPK